METQNNCTVKVGMIGNSQIGKTSLIAKYIDNTFDASYIETLGVQFFDKTVTVGTTNVTFTMWDLGGQAEFTNMLPLVCNDANALLFMFDLSNKSSLFSVKEWFRQARGFNKTAKAFLIGTKYDLFANLPVDEQIEMTNQAKKYAKAMKAPLIYCSSEQSINIQKIFKIILAKVFDLKCNVPVTSDGSIVEY